MLRLTVRTVVLKKLISSFMRNWIILCLQLVLLPAFAQDQRIWIHPNRGQWEQPIRYRVELTHGKIYLENSGFTYHLDNSGEILHPQHAGHAHSTTNPAVLEQHVIRHTFENASTPNTLEQDPSPFYRNYFLGKDPSKWQSQVYSVGQIIQQNIYPGVNLYYQGKSHQLAYAFELQAGVNPSIIQLRIGGANRVFIDPSGRLHEEHRFGEVITSAPKAWNISADGKRTKLAVRFQLKGTTLSYVFPAGFDPTQKIFIDPELTFSTFTGSTSDNWGFTAAPDAVGNVFGGGIVFASGYPITQGAFDATFGNASGTGVDIGISKFNASGSSLLYSTYLGGSGSETPHSIVCNAAGELFVFGVTSSNNFPITAGAFQGAFMGGPSENENNIPFTNGVDLFLAKLNPTGTSLLASTFVGGMSTDGLNTGILQFNYGDQFRGEIVLDALGNPCVASTTLSANFPTNNGFQLFLNGTQDAVVFKMNSNLTNMIWSSFLGGPGLDCANALQVSSSGEIYVAGGSTSPSMNFGNGHQPTNAGGLSDGFVARLSAGIPVLSGGTFMGTNEYDQTYFVQLDLNNNVYVFGQTEGLMPISPGTYGVANSGQFIRKYTPNLQTLSWNTTIGAGSGHVEISPTAFLVSDCYEIYLSGWGGTVNTIQSASQAVNSSSNGFPVTPDAFQSTTNGSNFYIAVLTPDAAGLEYATYMGGQTSSSNHVDGGTSRFDKSGRIYHAVCGGCSSNDFGFTTTQGVYSPNNPSPNCNMAVFKFELNQIEAIVGEPAPLICLPNPVVFNNNSSNGDVFQWNFGDGNTSTAVNPSHTYAGPGNYTVTLVVSDAAGCFSPDTTTFQVNIGDFNGSVDVPNAPICPGDTYQLNASGGASYQWSPANLVSNPTIPNPTTTLTETTTFTVVITDSCGTDTQQVTVTVLEGAATASNDTSVCIGNSVPLFATGGGTYAWSPTTSLDDPTSATPIATPTEPTTYQVTVISPTGCSFSADVFVNVFFTPPAPVIPDTVTICAGTSTSIQVSGADSYTWSPPTFIAPTTGNMVTVNPPQDTWYYCDFTNACGTKQDSVLVDVTVATIQAFNDTIICIGETANLSATGGISYQWSPSNSLNSSAGNQVVASPNQATTYTVVGTDAFGCTDTATVLVDVYPLAFIQTVPDIYAFFGDVVQLGATSTTPGTYIWSPSEHLSCVVCSSPTADPNQNFTYFVTYTDANGCSDSDSIQIIYDAVIYVPNTFTPNQSLMNDIFQAVGGNVKTFEMTIFNRWGEQIKTLRSLDEFWDGTYKDLPCPDGTYIWKLTYTDYQDQEFKRVGHINLLR